MNETLVFAAGLQFAYWFWNAAIQPGMTRFSDRIGETLGEISSDRLRRWFGSEAPLDAQGRVDESQLAQQRRITDAQVKVRDDAEWNSERFMDTTKRQLVQLLRDPTKYDMGELQIFFQDFGNPGIDLNLMLVQSFVGNVQASIADRLVMETIRNGKLPQLIAAMRRA